MNPAKPVSAHPRPPLRGPVPGFAGLVLLLLATWGIAGVQAQDETGRAEILRPTRAWLRMADSAPVEGELDVGMGWHPVGPGRSWQDDLPLETTLLPATGWYRLEFMAGPDATNRSWFASAGFVGNCSELRFNGVRIGQFGRPGADLPLPQRTLHAMPLPPGLLRSGTNFFDIRFVNEVGRGGLLGGPVGLVPAEVLPMVRNGAEFGRELFRGIVGGVGALVGLAALASGLARRQGVLPSLGLPCLLLGLQTLIHAQSLVGLRWVVPVQFVVLALLPLSLYGLSRRLVGSGLKTDISFVAAAAASMALGLFAYPNQKVIGAVFGMYLIACGIAIATNFATSPNRIDLAGWALVASIAALGIGVAWDMSLRKSPTLAWAALWWDPTDWAILFFMLAIGLALVRRDLRSKKDRSQLSERLLEAESTRRQEMARRLQDEVLQDLTYLKVRADDLRSGTAPDLRDRTAGDIAAGISVGIRHLHQMTEELLPIHVQGLSLATALRQLELMAQTAYRLRTTFTIPESPKLDPTTAEAIYRAAREAVTNAGCHAGGRNLRLTLEQSPGRAELTVEDDGTGFVPAERIARNHGLQYLRDRIEWLGGNVVIESKPGSGTRIAVVLPSPASDTEAGRRPRSGEGSGRASLR